MLQRGPILDQIRYMPAYLPLHLVGRLLPHLMQGPIPVHRVIQLGKMHEAIAVGPGYQGIDEGDDLVGISDRLTGSIDGRAERAIAMLVRGRDLNERHIDGPGSAWHEEFGNSGQKRRRITGTPGVDGLTFARTDEDRRSEEHTSELQSQSNLVCRLLLEK